MHLPLTLSHTHYPTFQTMNKEVLMMAIDAGHSMD